MASRIKGITVEIGGDTSGLEKSLSDVNNSIKKTQSQLRDVNNLLKLDPSNTILLAQKQELLQSAIGDTEKKLEALEQAQEDVAKAFERGDLGKDQYMAFQREVEETRGALNRYKADLSGLQSEQERMASNTERLNKLFAATGSSVDDYANVLGSRLVTAIKNGTASSDQLKSAIEKIGKSATGGKADIRQLTDVLDTVDDGQAVRNLINDLNDVGDAAQGAADDIGEIARVTNPEDLKGTLADALKGADIFVGVSAPGVVTGEMVSTMNADAILFALSNPVPEIMPDLAKAAGAKVVGTGRSDFPNQVNNVVAFPGIFKGALEGRASQITEEMKLAAAEAIAGLVSDDELNEDNILPQPFDPRVADRVSQAVKGLIR